MYGQKDNREMTRYDAPKEKYGITFYPVTMQNYMAYSRCKRALLMRQSTLPASYISMPYLEALFAVDADSGFALGLTDSLVKVLALATRLNESTFRVMVKTDEPSRISSIQCLDSSLVFRITPVQFSIIREVIARQNGDEIPDESENPELVEAERDLAQANAPNMDYDPDTLLDSVAYNCGRRRDELLDWTIREFEAVRRAINRDKRYTLCGTAEYSGMVKWKRGNPCPSWCYDLIDDGSAVLEPMSAFAARTGINAAAVPTQ